MNWLNRLFAESIVVAVIAVNALTIGLETAPWLPQQIKEFLIAIDRLCLAYFVAEIATRFIQFRLSFFKDPWRVFDFAVISVALIPASGPLSILRTLRIVRALRMISVIPKLRQVVVGLLAALPGLGAVSGILFLIFYVGSVMATSLFGQHFPEWFGTIADSCYTLFQVMTLESWSMGIVRPVMDKFSWAWVFFIPFILITTFTMLNLFIAVIVNAMQSETEEEAKRRADESKDERRLLMAEIVALRAEVSQIKNCLHYDSPAEITEVPQELS